MIPRIPKDSAREARTVKISVHQKSRYQRQSGVGSVKAGVRAALGFAVPPSCQKTSRALQLLYPQSEQIHRFHTLRILDIEMSI